MSLPSTGREGSRRASTRNPRRRQRLDTDSIGHQPRRKRSRITAETFDEPIHTNGDHAHESLSNGHAESRHRKSVTPAESAEFPMRSKKIVHKRALRVDAGAVMTQNAHYAMRQLASTPDVIRKSASDYHGSLLSSPPLALVVTRENAYIWNYTSPIPVAQPRTFGVPQRTRANEPVPLGQLLTSGSNNSVGLVLVSTVTGDISYWENIDTAESLSLFQSQNAGVKGNIGGLFSGESVVEITSAEHAGIILTLSSGRIAQVSLRDSQGRPGIQAQFLKPKESLNAGGLFSSIKGAFGVGQRRDLIGVATRPQGAHGQVQVISATSAAQIQVWELSWSGHCTQLDTIDFKDQLQSEFSTLEDGSPTKTAPPMLLQFSILPISSEGNEVSVIGEDAHTDLVFLARRSSSYALVEVTLTKGRAWVERITVLKGYTAQTPDEKPRLLVPSPAHSVIITFPQAFAVVSLADVKPSGPDAQLLMESHRAPKLFQDVVHFRRNQHISIIGASVESSDERTQQSNAIIFIKGYGLTRLSINQSPQDLNIPIKSRIEQAIYYGTEPNNIIDFERIDRSVYSSEEAEEAALLISDDILSSEPPFVSTAVASLQAQIMSRKDASLALVDFLKRHFAPVSRITRWKLLIDAEKLAAGLKLWTGYDETLADPANDTPTVLPAVIKVIRSKHSHAKHRKDTEIDEVRDWFIHDLRHLDQLCLQALALINNSYQKDSTLQNFTKLLSECDDIMFAVFETVFRFRTASASIYGFDPAQISEGVLESGWEELPEPWTATHDILNSLDTQVDNARNHLVDLYESADTQKEGDDQYVEKVVSENVRLVRILCRCYRERIGWCSAHYAEKYRHYAPSLETKFRRSREHHFKGLVTIGQAGSGLDIAEQYKDMESLVRLVMSETAYLVESLEDPVIGAGERDAIQQRMQDMEQRIRRYFKEFGDAFADPFFDSHLAGHRSYGLLRETSLFEQPLTRYLRAERSRGRLGWINEVLNCHDLKRAQGALQALAKDHETRLWNKKVELSLSKLAAWALTEDEAKYGADSSTVPTTVSKLDSELSVTAIQDAIYAHVRPLIREAMDHDAEVQLVTDTHAITIRQKLPALHQLLEIAFEDLLRHTALSAEQLIDVLTLMDSAPSPDFEVDLCGQEFYLALKVLDAAKGNMEDSRFQSALRVIWKRCYLMDPWDLIDQTGGRSESQIAERVRDTITAKTMALGFADVLAPGSAITVVKPAACIGAWSSVSDLSYRFPSSDVLDHLVRDNSVQDEELGKLIQNFELDRWVEACTQEAKKMAEEAAEPGYNTDLNRVDVSIASPKKWARVAQGENSEDELEPVQQVQDDDTFLPDEDIDASEDYEPPRRRTGSKSPKKNLKTTKTTNGTAPLVMAPGGFPNMEAGETPRKSKRLTRSQAGRDGDGDVEMS